MLKTVVLDINYIIQFYKRLASAAIANTKTIVVCKIFLYQKDTK